MQGALKELAPIYKSLDSLANVKEGRYYYYDASTEEFFQSAHGAMEFLDSYWGNGVLTGVLQPICRTASGENYKSLSDGIQAVYDSIIRGVDIIEVVGVKPGIPALDRNRILEDVDKLYKKVGAAAKGILQLVGLYKHQPEKRDVFHYHHKQFTQQLPDKIKNVYDKIVIQKAQDEMIAKEIWINEERKKKLARESLKRKEIGAGYQEALKAAEQRKIQAHLQEEKKKPDPITGLSQADVEKIERYLVNYQNRLHAGLKKQYRRDEENPCLYLFPAQTGLTWDIQYWNDKTVIHLSRSKSGGQTNVIGKGEYKKVTRSVEFKEGSLGKILANGCSVLASSRKRLNTESENYIVAENERIFLNRYRKVRGIVRVKKVSRYVTEKGAVEQSILMKYYNMGNLLSHIRKKDLAREKKNAVLLDILHGLVRLHKDDVINLDIKPDNILLENTSKSGRKNGISGAICDFGFCCYSCHVKPAGSLYYMAPEVAAAMTMPDECVTKVSTKADMWSLGCTFWLLYVGSYTPWMEIIKEHKLSSEAIEMMNKEDAIQEPEKETIEHLLWSMMRPNPGDRPTALEALKQLDWLLREGEACRQ